MSNPNATKTDRDAAVLTVPKIEYATVETGRKEHITIAEARTLTQTSTSTVCQSTPKTSL